MNHRELWRYWQRPHTRRRALTRRATGQANARARGLVRGMAPQPAGGQPRPGAPLARPAVARIR